VKSAAVPTGVAADADVPSWTCDTLRRLERRARSWFLSGFATACFSLGPRGPGSCSSSSRRRAPALSRMPLPSVHGLSVSFRVTPSDHRRAFCLSAYSARPLSWGLAPSSGRQHEGSGLFQGFPHPWPLRPRGSSPLDALIPFAPSRHLCRGRSWDCCLQGFSPPTEAGTTLMVPCPPGIA
jgi:hypothetical protein